MKDEVKTGSDLSSPPGRFILHPSSFILLLAVALFFHRLGERDLWSSHEARAAMDAADLLRPDSDGLPRLYDGRPELQKPPLYYWLVAGLGRVAGGVDGLAVRLPSAASAIVQISLPGSPSSCVQVKCSPPEKTVRPAPSVPTQSRPRRSSNTDSTSFSAATAAARRCRRRRT